MKDEKTFDGVIKAMEETESDKDRFLKAARLERHEIDRRYEMERLVVILNYLVGSVAMIGGFAVVFFFLYMVTK
uniref:Uncharacterized protein n=1 Tax=Dulem virus 35 TaxID=3145753 RepID=A0AAU8B0K8_9CAUD